MEYYDTDSIYRKTICRYDDTLKVTALTAEETIRMKLFLNSLYGKMGSCMHFIDGKEKNMNKDYIVIHVEEASDINKVGIVFKSKIVGVLKSDEGKAELMTDIAYNIRCTESYEDIVKQLV